MQWFLIYFWIDAHMLSDDRTQVIGYVSLGWLASPPKQEEEERTRKVKILCSSSSSDDFLFRSLSSFVQWNEECGKPRHEQQTLKVKYQLSRFSITLQTQHLKNKSRWQSAVHISVFEMKRGGTRFCFVCVLFFLHLLSAVKMLLKQKKKSCLHFEMSLFALQRDKWHAMCRALSLTILPPGTKFNSHWLPASPLWRRKQ